MDTKNDDSEVIMLAAYGDMAVARHDFTELNKQLRRGSLWLREAVLVGKNSDGTPTVLDTTNHHGRAGALMGATAGVVAGFFASPMVAMVAVGGVAGAVVAKMADHTLKTGLRHDVARGLAEGTAIVIALTGPFNELWVRRVLSGASSHVSFPYSEPTIASLERAVTEAMSAVSPNRAP
jgi:arylsulfatase